MFFSCTKSKASATRKSPGCWRLPRRPRRQGVGYNLTVRTSFGRISSELPVTSTGSIGGDSLSGTIGAGGCQIQLTDSNGSIEIAKAQCLPQTSAGCVARAIHCKRFLQDARRGFRQMKFGNLIFTRKSHFSDIAACTGFAADAFAEIVRNDIVEARSFFLL